MKLLVIEKRVVSYTPLCLKVVIEPFPSDFKGGLRFLGSSFSRHPIKQRDYTPQGYRTRIIK